MAREIIYRCNRCASVRGAANHWWVLLPAAGGGLTIQHFDEDAIGRDTEIYCGEECLLARISELLSATRRPEGLAA